MSYDVFLSYARTDLERALVVKDALEALDLSVFFDMDGLDGGDVFPDVLEQEVRSAGAVISLWDTHALSREWVRKECEIARERKTLIPLEVGPISDAVMTVALSKIHRISLGNFTGDAGHEGWQQTVRALARLLDRKDLIKARKEKAKEQAELITLREKHERLKKQKAKGGVRPWQWTLGSTVSLALAAGVGWYALEWQAEQTRNRLIPPEVRAQLDDINIQDGSAREKVEALLEDVSLTRLIQAAAIDGDTAYLAGTAYYWGVKVPENKTEAANLWDQACAGGNATGCTGLGFLYDEALGVEQDYARANALYTQGCEGGNATGCTNLGVLYDQALGVEQDYARANALYTQGCEGGNAPGCTNLGTFYAQALGVEQDYARANALYTQGCDGGNATGCTGLGVLYDEALGVEQDYARANALYTQGCEGGNATGCTNLGVLYANGHGTDTDWPRALELFEQGCAGGNELGCSNAEIARRRLPAAAE